MSLETRLTFCNCRNCPSSVVAFLDLLASCFCICAILTLLLMCDLRQRTRALEHVPLRKLEVFVHRACFCRNNLLLSKQLKASRDPQNVPLVYFAEFLSCHLSCFWSCRSFSPYSASFCLSSSFSCWEACLIFSMELHWLALIFFLRTKEANWLASDT